MKNISYINLKSKTKKEIFTELIFETVSARCSKTPLIALIVEDSTISEKISTVLKALKKNSQIDFFAKTPLDPESIESAYLIDKFAEVGEISSQNKNILFWIKT